MNARPVPDCTNFNRAISEEIRSDLASVLDLAMLDAQSPNIGPVLVRVARMAADERVGAEELLLCVKSIWIQRQSSIRSVWLPADRVWIDVVRTMMNAYYSASSTDTTQGPTA
jgi:hypothetical protein